MIKFFEMGKIVIRKEELQMFLRKWLIGLVVLFPVIVVVTALGSLSVSAESRMATQPMETGKIEVELNDDFFNPKVITIPNGETTTVILKNKGKKKHTFTVEKLGIDVEVLAGKEKSITVNPKVPGTYELICRYHFMKGMDGSIIVK
jgi:plastocyanin